VATAPPVYAKIEVPISEIAVFTSILDNSGNKDLNKCAVKVRTNKSGSKRARCECTYI